MHDIEPHFGWRERYRAEDDQLSPFFGRQYNEFGFNNRVYNYLIHPQWDEFGAETLYLKILYLDYEEQYAIIELIGEWNDAVHNDSMHLKREVIDPLISEGIRRFILIMEGVLNFHGGDTDYYEEWVEEVRYDGGWIALLNTHQHVVDELEDTRLEGYLHFGSFLNDLTWRPQKPHRVYEAIEGLLQKEIRRIY
ncbi:hypothetical protein QWY85_17725 [Neolewinella lacunae]|uniref:Uncharacterized protein n=1 Tax=Neolewinella lacunae TaxID=1517758 RepID=A0A923PN68_9BACT|nr:hypothetical protein [Neolewinella lacunae]MBC6995796.1 hypothetical protein [Neolewinella lacunae]MDN3636511.1 hypothetical protein [Neolewinella lacunae]